MTYYKPAYALGQYWLIPVDYDAKQITGDDALYDHSIRIGADSLLDLGYQAASEGLDEAVTQGGPEFWQGVCDWCLFDLDLTHEHDSPDFVVQLRDGTRLNLRESSMHEVTREHVLRYARAHSYSVGILPPDIFAVVDLREEEP